MISRFKQLLSFLRMTTTAKLLTSKVTHKMGKQVMMYTLDRGWFTSSVSSRSKAKEGVDPTFDLLIHFFIRSLN